MTEREEGFATRALRSDPGPIEQHPLAPALFPAATFAFHDVDRFAEVGERKISGGYLYSRWANPTVDALARTVADLEGAEAAACSGSGMAAIHAALGSVLRAGDHVVTSEALYGGTYGLLNGPLAAAGVERTAVDITDLAAVERAWTERTRVLYAETIGNPTLPVADLEALAALAHERGALLVVDATFTPPCGLRPIERGADLSIHSLTKYIGGHSDVTGGVVSGSHALIDVIRMRAIDLGAVLSPFDAWLAARGLQTLSLRWERACDNALAIARALTERDLAERVLYPGLPDHPQHDLAMRLLDGRGGAMLTFDVPGGLPAGKRFLERVRVCHAAASLGSTHTLVVHPASITHTQLTPEERAAAGIGEGTIRLSAGIEDPEDLIADLERALA